MNLSELELKRGDEIILKADLSAVKLTVDITEKLYLTVKDSNGIIQISKELPSNTVLMIDSKHFLSIKH